MASDRFVCTVHVPRWRRVIAIWAFRLAWLVSVASLPTALRIREHAIRFVLNGVRIEPA